MGAETIAGGDVSANYQFLTDEYGDFAVEISVMPIASPYEARPCVALEVHTRSQLNRSSGSSASSFSLCEEEASLPAGGGLVPLRPDVFNVIRLEGSHETNAVSAYVNGELLASGAADEIVYEWSGFYFGETTTIGSGTSIISDFCFSIGSLACSIDADGDGVVTPNPRHVTIVIAAPCIFFTTRLRPNFCIIYPQNPCIGISTSSIDELNIDGASLRPKRIREVESLI